MKNELKLSELTIAISRKYPCVIAVAHHCEWDHRRNGTIVRVKGATGYAGDTDELLFALKKNKTVEIPWLA